MKKIIAILIFICSLFFTSSVYSQACCNIGKKVKLKKASKRSPGALVGVKGISDKKRRKTQQKEWKKAVADKRAVIKREKDSIENINNDSLENFEEELIEIAQPKNEETD